MDTITKKQLEKYAGVLDVVQTLFGVPKNLAASYLTLATAVGAVGGVGAAALASAIKSKDKKALTLEKKKKFYEAQMREMENTNWLNDIMAMRKKLETSKLSSEEREILEDRYKKLINK